MPGTSREGVIKFQLDFQKGPAPAAGLLHELNAWRSIFLQLGLIGQDPARYQGYGFGNLSRRLAKESFLISATQTGHLAELSAQDYSVVHTCDPLHNCVTASGQAKPSSEALSHGALYQANQAISWVMHLHSPEIFRSRAKLELYVTSPDAGYGTPEMAAEIKKAVTLLGSESGLFVMGGHEDGILAFGKTAEETGLLVLKTLAMSRRKA